MFLAHVDVDVDVDCEAEMAIVMARLGLQVEPWVQAGTAGTEALSRPTKNVVVVGAHSDDPPTSREHWM